MEGQTENLFTAEGELKDYKLWEGIQKLFIDFLESNYATIPRIKRDNSKAWTNQKIMDLFPNLSRRFLQRKFHRSDETVRNCQTFEQVMRENKLGENAIGKSPPRSARLPMVHCYQGRKDSDSADSDWDYESVCGVYSACCESDDSTEFSDSDVDQIISSLETQLAKLKISVDRARTRKIYTQPRNFVKMAAQPVCSACGKYRQKTNRTQRTPFVGPGSYFSGSNGKKQASADSIDFAPDSTPPNYAEGTDRSFNPEISPDSPSATSDAT